MMSAKLFLFLTLPPRLLPLSKMYVLKIRQFFYPLALSADVVCEWSPCPRVIRNLWTFG